MFVPRKGTQKRTVLSQVVRAIAVAIVLEGTMLPNQELLLRHAIQYFS
eukprot:COSAG06_NODE_769_length_12440_cov_7.241796_14_plen_47_part_01